MSAVRLIGYATGMTTMEDYVTTYSVSLLVTVADPAALGEYVRRRRLAGMRQPAPDEGVEVMVESVLVYLLGDVPGGVDVCGGSTGITSGDGGHLRPYRIPVGAGVVVRVGEMWVSGGTVVAVHGDGTGNVQMPRGETTVWLPGADRRMWGQAVQRRVNGGMLYRVPLDDRTVLEEEPF